MNSLKPVNREEEIALFDRLISGQIAENILLIEAGGGMGKSVLLREYVNRCPNEIPKVVVDFKNKGINLAEVFSRICDRLGRDQLPHLIATIGRFVDPTAINIEDNTMLGRTDIDIALSGPDEETRQFRRAELAGALFEDLHALNRVLFVIDTFEACDTVVKEWFSASFLCRVPQSKKISVVLGGREVPEPSLEWVDCCHLLPLQGLDPEHWHTFAAQVGADVQQEWIDGFCDLFKGHPLKMAEALSSYAGGRVET